MRSKTSQIMGTIALLSCFVCPILETFDHWDPPIQTGNDTEYTLVILGLCVGAAYLFARPVLRALKQIFAEKFRPWHSDLFHRTLLFSLRRHGSSSSFVTHLEAKQIGRELIRAALLYEHALP